MSLAGRLVMLASDAGGGGETITRGLQVGAVCGATAVDVQGLEAFALRASEEKLLFLLCVYSVRDWVLEGSLELSPEVGAAGVGRLGIKGHYATGAAPWALRARRAAGAAWGGGDAPGAR